MAQTIDPKKGFVNPPLGWRARNNRWVVKRRPKTPKVPGFMRAVLAENVRRLMDRHYHDRPNKPRALATDAGVSLSTVQRIIAGEVGATTDNIENIATAFDVSAYQLLIPALDPSNPQVVAGAMAHEKRMYRRWQQARVGQIPTKETA